VSIEQLRSFRAGTSSITLIIDFVDRIGSRRMLVLGLGVNATARFIFGRAPSYSRLLLATALLGLANSIFRPADYAFLSA
jgi:predicted MFS family arabinose efflux permease